MFKEIKVNNFRALQGYTFKIGKYLTMLAGWNATGKSTLLALLAHSTELKKIEGLTYTNKQFRADFSEILKGSKQHDSTANNLFEITWEKDSKVISKRFRITWQDKGTRFRLLPQDLKTNKADKFPFPVVYLGLSRLYPIGEVPDNDLRGNEQVFRDEDDKKWIQKNQKHILSTQDDVKDVTHIEFNSFGKNASGINTEKYDWKSNSLGQYNLNQILFSLLSFKALKKN